MNKKKLNEAVYEISRSEENVLITHSARLYIKVREELNRQRQKNPLLIICALPRKGNWICKRHGEANDIYGITVLENMRKLFHPDIAHVNNTFQLGD